MREMKEIEEDSEVKKESDKTIVTWEYTEILKKKLYS